MSNNKNDYGYIPGQNANLKFSAYNLDPERFSFLKPFEQNWQIIRDEYLKFLQDKTLDFATIQTVMKPKSQSIMTRTATPHVFTVVGFLFNGQALTELIEHYNITWPELSRAAVIALIEKVNHYFPATRKIITEAFTLSGQRIRNVYYNVYQPGFDVKLHVNNNPHTYRAYLGLKVPPGNVAIKVGGDDGKLEHYHFMEGKFLVLDHMYPHCPHNLTTEPRLALIIDFLKPDQPLQAMQQLAKEIVAKRMQDNIYSYGVFDKDDVVPDDVFIKYGLAEQLRWGNKVTG